MCENDKKKNNTRVAVIFDLKDFFGGAERRIIRIYNGICAEDHTIKCDIIIRGSDKAGVRRALCLADCDTSHIHRLIAFKHSIACLLYLFRINRYNLIHFSGAIRFNTMVQLLCNIKRKRSIYTLCSYSEAYNYLPCKQMKRVKRLLKYANNVDLLYPAGKPFVSQYVKGRLSITPGSFTDLDVFKPSNKRKTIVFAAARLEECKNSQLLLRGIRGCVADVRQFGYKIIILGKGRDSDYIDQYIQKNHMDDVVRLVGYDRTSKYLPSAAVFLSLQMIENYPSQSLIEAVASGCYLIITDVGDSRKCADESFASFIKDDAEALSNAIKEYLFMDDSLKQMAVQNARLFAENYYSIHDSTRYFKAIIKGDETDMMLYES